jgi:type II secretory pathway component PulC
MQRIFGQFNAEPVALTANQPKLLTGVAATRPAYRLTVIVKNTSGATLYLGGPGLTAANGYPVDAANILTVDAADGLYGLSVAGGTVNILEGF